MNLLFWLHKPLESKPLKPTIPETWEGCSEEELLYYLATFLRHCGIQGEPENYLYVLKEQLMGIMALTPEEAIAWLPYLQEKNHETT